MILFFLMFFFGCDNSLESKRASYLRKSRSLKIGVVCNNLATDEMLVKGVKLAIEEVNKSLPQGKTLSIEVKEDNMSVNQGITNASLLAEDLNTLAVIGHLESYISIPTSAIYEHHGVLMMNPSSTAKDLMENGYEYVFRAIPNDMNLATELVDYFNKVNLKKVNICYVSNAYGLSFANSFEDKAESLGMDIVDRVSYDVGDLREFNRIIKRWENYDFDSVLFIGETDEALKFYKVLHERGITVPVVSGESVANLELLKADKELIEGKIFPSIYIKEEVDAEKSAFISKFKATYEQEPERLAALAYDSIKLIAQAIKDGKSYVPKDIASSLKKIKNYKGVVQTYNFDKTGDLIMQSTVGIKKIEDNKFKYLGRY